MALPKKKKWPKGLKRRLAKLARREAKKAKRAARLAENKKIEAAIQAARNKLNRA